jgi:hypothetical protein
VAFDPGRPFLVSSLSGDSAVGVGECSEDEAPDREDEACKLLDEGIMTLGDGPSPQAH